MFRGVDEEVAFLVPGPRAFQFQALSAHFESVVVSAEGLGGQRAARVVGSLEELCGALVRHDGRVSGDQIGRADVVSMSVAVHNVRHPLRGHLADSGEKLVAEVRRCVEECDACLRHEEHRVQDPAGDSMETVAQVCQEVTGRGDVRPAGEVGDGCVLRHGVRGPGRVCLKDPVKTPCGF